MNNVAPAVASIIVVILVTLFLVIAEFRKPSSVLKNKPKKLFTFKVKISPDEAIKEICAFGKAYKYSVAEILPDQSRIVLGDESSLFSYGFFYPVYLTPQQDGELLFEVGIASKAIQIGPVVWQRHQKFHDKLKEFLLKPS